jgi:hypothetical protein
MFSQSYKEKCKACQELQALKPSSIGSIWYPTMDELVALVKAMPKFAEVNDYNLLSKMRIGIAQACCDKYLRHQTLWDYWLMFWMSEKTKKCWHEGAKEWK